LATKSLTSIVKPQDIIQDSEYLDTLLIAIPKQGVKEFYKTYESLSPMVVPRSANEIASDDEFSLFSVVVFKKHSAEFVHKAREKRWTPRDYKYKQGGKEEEAKEVDKLEKDERKIWGEALRLARTGYSESAMVWIHVLALRVFVETVLRYGLPLDFVAGLVQVSSLTLTCHVRIRMLIIQDRQRTNKPRKPNRISTPIIPTSAETPLVGIVKGASRRMIKPCRMNCKAQATWGTRNTPLSCTMSLKLYSKRSHIFGSFTSSARASATGAKPLTNVELVMSICNVLKAALQCSQKALVFGRAPEKGY
jgi:hypothetical protein